MRRRHIWVVIAAYNEVGVIARVVVEVRRCGYTVLLIDDGSTDATAATAEKAGAVVIRVIVGGGMGRTPIVGHVIRESLPWQHMLTYVEAILRVYNRYGRRDNIYKARIKILVKALGMEEFTRQVEAEWEASAESLAASVITDAEFARVAAHFEPRIFLSLSASR